MSEIIAQTRIKKWQIYRNEIINEGILIDKIANESIIAKMYKDKIDKLNPRILSNLQSNRSLSRLVSIDTNQSKEVNMLRKFVDLIDDQRLMKINNEIDEWSLKYKHLSILDEKGNVSQQWLNEDDNYNEISEIVSRIEISSNRWASFQFDSKNQLVKLDLLEKNDNTRIIMNDLSSIKPNEERISKFGQSIYIVATITSVIFLLASIALLIVKIGNL